MLCLHLIFSALVVLTDQGIEVFDGVATASYPLPPELEKSKTIGKFVFGDFGESVHTCWSTVFTEISPINLLLICYLHKRFL